MASLISTERLNIREFQQSDANWLACLHINPQVMRYSLNGPLSRTQSDTSLKSFIEHQRKFGYGIWAVEIKHGIPIGRVGLLNWEDDPENNVELVYRLMPEFWGKGLATEAALACRNHAFERLNLPRLVSYIHPQNSSSANLALKMGMNPVDQRVVAAQLVDVYQVENNKLGD